MNMNRLVWGMLAAALVLAVGLSFLVTWVVMDDRLDDTEARLQGKITNLEQQVAGHKKGVTASGGGVNLKFMTDAASGLATVPLYEVFSFDNNHAFCRVDTNTQAFVMDTYKMGKVKIQPHRFFMSMVATSIDQVEFETDKAGNRQVTMKGKLDCSTEVVQAETIFGSRTAAEPATYLIEATDGGEGGGQAGDSFAFTAFFDPVAAPVNYAIFGPEFTFTGQMIQGEITISDAGAVKLSRITKPGN